MLELGVGIRCGDLVWGLGVVTRCGDTVWGLGVCVNAVWGLTLCGDSVWGLGVGILCRHSVMGIACWERGC